MGKHSVIWFGIFAGVVVLALWYISKQNSLGSSITTPPAQKPTPNPINPDSLD